MPARPQLQLSHPVYDESLDPVPNEFAYVSPGMLDADGSFDTKALAGYVNYHMVAALLRNPAGVGDESYWTRNATPGENPFEAWAAFIGGANAGDGRGIFYRDYLAHMQSLEKWNDPDSLVRQIARAWFLRWPHEYVETHDAGLFGALDGRSDHISPQAMRGMYAFARVGIAPGMRARGAPVDAGDSLVSTDDPNAADFSDPTTWPSPTPALGWRVENRTGEVYNPVTGAWDDRVTFPSYGQLDDILLEDVAWLRAHPPVLHPLPSALHSPNLVGILLDRLPPLIPRTHLSAVAQAAPYAAGGGLGLLLLRSLPNILPRGRR